MIVVAVTPAQAQPVVTLWLAPAVPVDVQAAAGRLVTAGRYAHAPDPDSADLRLNVSAAPDAEGLRWVYAVVAPFPTVPDGVTQDDIARYWAGDTAPLAYLSTLGVPPTLVLGAGTYETVRVLMGAPADSSRFEIAPEDGVLDAAWEARASGRFSLVPFHRLEPRWKVLHVDGVNLLDPDADLSAYPYAVTVTVDGDAAQAEALRADLALVGGWGSAHTNRDPARMTTLMMTGVTALTRGTARAMEAEGVLYPAGDIAPLLQSADLLHINNEVAFAEDCPDPEQLVVELTFCSKPAYFDLLTHVGADIIELTGNHTNDWGVEAFYHTLALYEAAGMGTFGGGRDAADAARPLIVAHNGNRIGFLGCNPVGAERAWASEAQGGALRCDYDAFTRAITELTRVVDVVVVTQQYWEIETIYPSAAQANDFARLARAGADIVSGSQSHVPQGFAFQHGAFIHYGLGNLFFDQLMNLDVRRLFIDRHVIYNGRHISTELLTGMRDDAARPYPMSPNDRATLLWRAFNASGW
ncbi:MAG: hypothetical protein Kow00120_30100 [Anaerolineae bacterium]